MTIPFFCYGERESTTDLRPLVLLTVLRAKVVQELFELQAILAYIDSLLENIKQFLNGFVNPPNEIDMDALEPDDESVDTPLVSPFIDSDDDSDDGEVLNELEEYGNVGKLCHKKFSVGHAVWHDRVVWHEPEQFSSELNKISLELYTVQRSVQRCVHVSYTLTKWYQEPGYDKQRQKTKTFREYKNYLLSAEDTDTGADGTTKGRNQNRKTARDKVVNIGGDSDDALVCCVKNTVEDHIMNSGASSHATYCKKELDRFRLSSGKVRLADDKILDIAGVGDVFLKTSFGTSWTLKDVRYIPGLNKRLILVGQLDEEGYHVGFKDQQWIGISMLAFKGNVPDVRKVDIYFCKPGGLGKQKNLSFIMSVESSEDQESLGALEDASKQGMSIEDIEANVDVSLVDETQERQNDDLMFDSRVLEDDVMHVEAKVDGKDEQSKKPNDSTAGVAVTSATMMEVDRLLAERLQSKEREKLTDEEKAKLFMELIWRKEESILPLSEHKKRETGPPTKAQKESNVIILSTWKEDAWIRKKRRGKEQTERSSKKQKVKEEKESEEVDEVDEVELKKLLVIKKDEDIAIDAIPLATKLPVIVDYKLHKEGIRTWKAPLEDSEGDTHSQPITSPYAQQEGNIFNLVIKESVLSTADEAYGKAVKRKMKGLNASS
ncbi:hypothetical protein Tco_1121685 [Tanacetum coccineum]|uniref:Retrovirus-related Pol polyprotein from transposon TNT 1-94-like beta-barrel domain-containing protein n=1 Tax=Tanacetum coccineum TaxID=301880 RepID=A0ABQ5IZX7_9ASTR